MVSYVVHKVQGNITYTYDLHEYDTVEQATYKDGSPDTSAEFRDANNKPAPMLKYRKKVNGTYYVVEAVPESRFKKFLVVSAYMDADGGTQASDAVRPGNTPNASLASSPSANSTVSQPQNHVNRKVSPNNSTGAAPYGFDPLSNAANQCSAIPPGTNAARVVDIPRQMDARRGCGQKVGLQKEATECTQKSRKKWRSENTSDWDR